MLTVHATLPSGRYGLMPVIDETDDLGTAQGPETYAVILEPVNEIDGDPADDSDEPEKIFLDADTGGGPFTVQSNRGRQIEGLFLDASTSCDYEEDCNAWPINQDASFQTPLGPLTVADDYVLIPVESARTNPDCEAPGAHNWLVFDLAEETQVVVDNGAIIIGDAVIDLLELCENMVD